jgi:hypothetical protein
MAVWSVAAWSMAAWSIASTAKTEIVYYANIIHLISITPRFRMRLPNAEKTSALEVNEVEVKGSARLTSAIWSTAHNLPLFKRGSQFWILLRAPRSRLLLPGVKGIIHSMFRLSLSNQ